MSGARRILPPAALVVLTFAAYANSFSAGLPLDNSLIIGADPRLGQISWGALQDIFTRNYWWPSLQSDLYRPLTTLSYWFNFSVLGNGTAPFGYHVVNLLLHVLNVLLVRRIALQLTVPPATAWLAAAIFAVHPIAVEAVTNIVGRADLLSTWFILISALAWLRAASAAEDRIVRRWRVVAATTAVLAVLAKETGVLAMAAAALCELGRARGRVTLRSCRDLALTFAPALVTFVAVRIAMRPEALPLPVPFTDNPIAHAGLVGGLMTALGIAGRYFALFAWPATLSCDYSYPQLRLFGDGAWPTIQPLLAVAGFAFVAWWLWRRRLRLPLMAAGALWSVVMMTPTANVFVKIGSIFAERFFYLPSIGAACVAAAGWEAARGFWAGRATAVRWLLPAAVLLALGARTSLRNRDWRDELTLWAAAVRACPESFKTHKGYAAALFDSGTDETKVDRAIAEAGIAWQRLTVPPLAIERDECATRVDLALYCRVKGQHVARREGPAASRPWFQRALAVLDEAERVNSWTDAEARRRLIAAGEPPETIGFTGNADVPIQRGLVLLELGDLAGAEASARAAQRLAPGRIAPLSIFARVDHANGNYDAVAVRLLQVVLIERDHEQAWRDLEALYRQLGLAGAVRKENGHYGIELAAPRVRVHMNTAFADMVRTFRAARARSEAKAWVERAVNDYGCPPALFADDPTPPR